MKEDSVRSPGDARLTSIRAESVAIFSRVIKKKATCKKKEGERDGGRGDTVLEK